MYGSMSSVFKKSKGEDKSKKPSKEKNIPNTSTPVAKEQINKYGDGTKGIAKKKPSAKEEREARMKRFENDPKAKKAIDTMTTSKGYSSDPLKARGGKEKEEESEAGPAKFPGKKKKYADGTKEVKAGTPPKKKAASKEPDSYTEKFKNTKMYGKGTKKLVYPK